MTDLYGTQETNGLFNGPAYHYNRKAAGLVDWTEPGLKITRFRIVSDPGFPQWDVTYCHGVLDGEAVDVQLPFSDLPKWCRYKGKDGAWKKGGWKACLASECKKAFGKEWFSVYNQMIRAASTLC